MPEVDLTIIANNQEFMKSINDAKKAEGDFYADWQKNMDLTAEQNFEVMKGMQDELKRLGISEDEFLKKYKQAADGQKGILQQLNEDLSVFKKMKESATTTQDIEKFNKKIKETEGQIKKLNTGTKETTFSFDKLKGLFLRVAGGVGTVIGAFAGVTAIMKRSEQGAEFLERKMAGLKASFSVLTGELSKVSDSIISNNDKTSKWGNVLGKALTVLAAGANVIPAVRKYINDLTNKMNEASAAAENYTRKQQELDDLQRSQIVPRAKANQQIAEARLLYEDETKSITERIDALKKASNLEIETTESEIKLQDQIIANIKVINEEKRKSGALRDEDELNLQNALAKRIDLETASMMKQRKLASTIANAETELNREKNEKIKKQQEDFLKLLEDLQGRYQEAQLEGLSGKARIDKEQEFALKELEIFKKSLEAKGKLTKEQYLMIETVKTSIIKKGNLEREKLDQESKLQRAEYDRALLSTLLSNAEDEIDLSRKTEEEKLELKIAAYQKAIAMLSTSTDEESKAMAAGLKRSIKFMIKDLEDIQIEKEFNLGEKIFKAIGIDPEGPESKWIKEWANSVVGSIATIIEAESDLAAKRRENAENRISELESQLDEELSLQEQGLANNVNNVKKEIEQTKAEKQKAVEQEKQLQQAQMALDTVTQVSSLITASANIFKAFSAIPVVGVPLAWAAIASMFGLMVTAKVKASQAAKLEQGGYIDEYGVIQGKRHSQGGEPLTKHVEIEQGEGVGVFNRGATQYYGGMLPKWVQSINNKNFPKFDVKPEIKANQIFDLKTSSMNSELKAIKNGIDNLNNNLIAQTQTNHKQGIRIEKQGNRTRIVHEK